MSPILEILWTWYKWLWVLSILVAVGVAYSSWDEWRWNKRCWNEHRANTSRAYLIGSAIENVIQVLAFLLGPIPALIWWFTVAKIDITGVLERRHLFEELNNQQPA